MLDIINPEFFGFDIELGEDDLISINVMIDPQNFELKTYKRTPFSSIVIKNKEYHDNIMAYGHTRQMILELLHDAKLLPVIQYNLYTDQDDYDRITKVFENRLFHTMLYYIDFDTVVEMHSIDEYFDYPIISIGATPVSGIVTPIQKSSDYVLYNGALIQCKPYPFAFNDEDSKFYNKILYHLANIRSHFEFHEFRKSDEISVNGKVLSGGVRVSHEFVIDPYHNYDFFDIRHIMHDTFVPANNREDLFSKPSKNIFYLSDVPKDIMMSKNETLRVKL